MLYLAAVVTVYITFPTGLRVVPGRPTFYTSVVTILPSYISLKQNCDSDSASRLTPKAHTSWLVL